MSSLKDIQYALNGEPQEAFIEPTITAPSDNTVELPGGYLNAAGEVIRIAEVREINGKDEEGLTLEEYYKTIVL